MHGLRFICSVIDIQEKKHSCEADFYSQAGFCSEKMHLG